MIDSLGIAPAPRDRAVKVALITGASRGIGKAIALAFAREGMRLVLIARGREALETLRQELRQVTDSVEIVPGDVCEPSTATRAVSLGLNQFGRIDVLVNNAGIAIHKPLHEMAIADFDQVMNTNMRGTFLFSRAVVPVFQRQGSGSIVNIGSGAGTRGIATETAYCASKFAQRGFSLALDQEVRAHNIRVSLITAGNVATEFAGVPESGAVGRAQNDRMSPEDVARAVLFAATQSRSAHLVELVLRPPRDRL